MSEAAAELGGIIHYVDAFMSKIMHLLFQYALSFKSIPPVRCFILLLFFKINGSQKN